uniref:TRAF-type domain-containing protein n=1 Tax=Cucumis sativus TaxID=3659 RepID=A0A0A0L1F8_CUCSA
MDAESPNVDLPTTDKEIIPEKIEDEEIKEPFIHCELCDAEIVHKLAQVLLPGLSTACVDNTSGDIFRTPGSVAADIRKEMVDYLTMRSETCVAESVILDNPSEAEVSDHPYDIISDFVDDFSATKRNLFSRVSGWILSEKREDKIDDFVQEMDVNGFWPLDRREAIAQTLLKNVDFKSEFHCDKKFHSVEELAGHVENCGFRSLTCTNEGCTARFCASHAEQHDSICPFKIILCEQKCSAFIMRREMDRHCITVCPMKLVNCPFHNLGCQSPVPYCLIAQHCSESFDSHLLHILHSVHKEANEETLIHRQQQLEEASSLDHLRGLQNLRLLTSKIKEMDSQLGPLVVICRVEDTEEAKDDSDKSDEEKEASKVTENTKDAASNVTQETKEEMPNGSEETKDGSIANEEERKDASPTVIEEREAIMSSVIEETKDAFKTTEETKDASGKKEASDASSSESENEETKEASDKKEASNASSEKEETKDASDEKEASDASSEKEETKDASDKKEEAHDASSEKEETNDASNEKETKDLSNSTEETNDGSNAKGKMKDDSDSEEEMKNNDSDSEEEMKNDSDVKEEEMKNASDVKEEEVKNDSDSEEENNYDLAKVEEVKKESEESKEEEKKDASNVVKDDEDEAER